MENFLTPKHSIQNSNKQTKYNQINKLRAKNKMFTNIKMENL